MNYRNHMVRAVCELDLHLSTFSNKAREFRPVVGSCSHILNLPENQKTISKHSLHRSWQKYITCKKDYSLQKSSQKSWKIKGLFDKTFRRCFLLFGWKNILMWHKRKGSFECFVFKALSNEGSKVLGIADRTGLSMKKGAQVGRAAPCKAELK